MFICGKSKDDLLSESATAPKEDDPAYKSWKANNNMVMSWLINSMTPEIGENFLLYATAAEIWEAAKITFSSSENTSEIFETESVLHELKQGDLSVTQYYSLLTRHWQKIDRIDTHKWKCREDGKLYRSIVETKRVFKFLSGLNKDLDEARGRVLSTKPLPSIREAFSVIRYEESLQKIMLGDSTTPSAISDGSALSVSSDNHAAKVSTTRKHKNGLLAITATNQGTLVTLLANPWETGDWKPRKASSDQESREISSLLLCSSKDQLELLQSRSPVSTSLSNPHVNGNALMIKGGNISIVFHSKSAYTSSWIVDSEPLII
ncbi:hypothetical protein Scep_023423 [Stephania cephalantha]|uniref:Retrotransposon gag domain-containing protein n=1 Tax=Stephania cephalantha TaxID=152367 RepID=A0AAP0F057_9MAGN